MEELETGYDPEEPADQEEEITEPEEEGPEQPEADQEETEPAGPDQEEDTETEDTEPEETEPEEAEPDGNPEEEEPEDGAYDTVTDAEEEPEEEPEEESEEEPEEPEQETVSGNDPAGSGDVTVFPDGYDFSAPGEEPAGTEYIVQAVEKQSDIMTAGFTCTCFMLGLLAGAVLIAGFRLRRV